MTFKPIILPYGSIEAEALRCERDAVISEFKVLAVPQLINKTGWREDVAMFVMVRLILAYEIGAEALEAGGRAQGNKLTAPPGALAPLRREVYALTGDTRAVALVDHAFLKGWKRNKRRKGGAPKKTAAATIMEMRTCDKQKRYRSRVRLKQMIEATRLRSGEGRQ